MKAARKNEQRYKVQASKRNVAGHDAAKILAGMARIDDDMTVYLIGMLIDRIAALAAARRDGTADPPGVRMQ